KGKLFDRDMARKMEFLYREIESGRFARSLMNENKTGMKNLNARIRTAQYSPLQKAHNSLAKKLSAK
ncbi:MAG TPA: hypothetical protein DEO84_06760, partial [candidate division Zixibacteria bacterium]|nr:hypothetical protein [candidate division Zixibacteria bacterium]